MGIRVINPGRKSRKGDDEDTEALYARQDDRTANAAERLGHTIVHTTHDTISSQTMPWERKDLKSWMTDPDKLAMYDGLMIEADRLSRGDDPKWHDIESWCYEHGKVIITTDDVQFPPRDDSDRYQWVGLKRRARTEWESTRDKHAHARDIARRNGSAYGSKPYGYKITGEKYHKAWEIDESTSELVREIFERVAGGQSAKSIAEWLSVAYKRPRRPRWVMLIIRNPRYCTGQGEWWTFEPIISRELWNSANAAMDAASHVVNKGGNPVLRGYSARIFCPCGAPYHHQKSERGVARYYCSRGRRGVASESKCGNPSLIFDQANDAVDAVMSAWGQYEVIPMVTGGDAARKAEIETAERELEKANRAKDRRKVAELNARLEELENTPAEPIRTFGKMTGRTWGDEWRSANFEGKRDLLRRATVIVTPNGAEIEYNEDYAEVEP